MYYTKCVAIGTEVSVRYKESGHFSGVVVKRGSTINSFAVTCVSCIMLKYTVDRCAASANLGNATHEYVCY